MMLFAGHTRKQLELNRGVYWEMVFRAAKQSLISYELLTYESNGVYVNFCVKAEISRVTVVIIFACILQLY